MTEPNLTHWPERAPKHLPLPETSLWFNLEVAATRYPRKTAIVFYDTVLSYAGLKTSAEHLAGFLQHRCAVERGDRVALFLQPDRLLSRRGLGYPTAPDSHQRRHQRGSQENSNQSE
jgi:non-ribosomal peptide synthetase component E (peptide arylation enzyme)